jgi:hypothetical protein
LLLLQQEDEDGFQLVSAAKRKKKTNTYKVWTPLLSIFNVMITLRAAFSFNQMMLM